MPGHLDYGTVQILYNRCLPYPSQNLLKGDFLWKTTVCLEEWQISLSITAETNENMNKTKLRYHIKRCTVYLKKVTSLIWN